VLVVGAVSTACATTRAQAPVNRPALEVPPVPPRVVEAVPLPTAPPPEPVGDLPTTAPPTAPKPRAAPRDTQKPEAKPAETAEPPAQPAAPATSTVPPLRTARTGDGVQAERQVREIIGRANGLLARVDYQKLTPERRKAYDQAKQFIEGADLAIRDAKYEYALELADKAETLAKGLQG
jgi:hypothetical protein